MEHELAIKNQAVERYILAEMPPAERDAFEEHFFTCELCAADVRATSAFLENAKGILNERPKFAQPGRFAAWFRPLFAFPAAIAAACMAIIAYQNIAVLPALKAPHALTAGVPLDGITRSKAPAIRQGEPLHFQLPWEGGASGNRVWAEIENGSKAVSSGAVETPAPNQPLDVYFPGTVKPGRYTVDVRNSSDGRGGKELFRGDFEVTP